MDSHEQKRKMDQQKMKNNQKFEESSAYSLCVSAVSSQVTREYYLRD
ncbi:MAG TPA: hypothetical protein VK250_04505 [Nitrososphaeraceae archaeon]|nr:hypothetical protein [Nitrososphaeraceae archaeon]